MYIEPEEQYRFINLMDLIEKLEMIPDAKWCKDQTEDKKGRNCGLGLINKIIIGQHSGWINAHKQLAPMGIDLEELVYRNNSDQKGAKHGTLSYLRDLLIEQAA